MYVYNTQPIIIHYELYYQSESESDSSSNPSSVHGILIDNRKRDIISFLASCILFSNLKVKVTVLQHWVG